MKFSTMITLVSTASAAKYACEMTHQEIMAMHVANLTRATTEAFGRGLRDQVD